MRLGVCDYLVKPIVMQEFVQTVRKLQVLCEQERRRTPETVGSLETVLSGVLHSGMPLNEETTAFLERAYGLGTNDNILELLFYLGDGFPDSRGRARRRIEELLKGQDLGGFCIIDVEYDKSVLALVYGYSSRQAFEAWYQYQIRLWRREMPEDNLGFGITEVSCAGDLPRIRKLAQQFHAYFSGIKIYTPGEIKHSYVRFLWSFLSIAKEVGEPFSVYIRNYRLSKAKELLIGTQFKQYEIAEKVGYTDAKYFARVFKECVGVSPAEYRKSCK